MFIINQNDKASWSIKYMIFDHAYNVYQISFSSFLSFLGYDWS